MKQLKVFSAAAILSFGLCLGAPNKAQAQDMEEYANLTSLISVVAAAAHTHICNNFPDQCPQNMQEMQQFQAIIGVVAQAAAQQLANGAAAQQELIECQADVEHLSRVNQQLTEDVMTLWMMAGQP